MDERDKRIKKALTKSGIEDKEIEEMMHEALTDSIPLDYDSLWAVILYINDCRTNEAMIHLMKTGDMKAVYVGKKPDPKSVMNIDDYVYYRPEDEEVVKSKDPRIKKRLEELEKADL